MELINVLLRLRFLRAVQVNAERELRDMLSEQGIELEGGPIPPTALTYGGAA